jgi:hypothetical protein
MAYVQDNIQMVLKGHISLKTELLSTNDFYSMLNSTSSPRSHILFIMGEVQHVFSMA